MNERLFVHDTDNCELFANNFDHAPFLFRHSFHDLDLFKMPALLALAEKAMAKRNRSHFESGDAAINEYFNAPPEKLTIVQALEKIAEGKNWVILKRIHEEPAYREVLDRFIAEISTLTGVDIRAEYYDPILTIFITSPNRLTPYHMDSESNFLAQVQGSKSVHLYDGNDRSVLSIEDLERYWTGHFNAAKYRTALGDGNWVHQISPGTGVFNPATFPHWVQNGDAVSVSVSINFKRLRNPALSAYRMNHYLRKLGLKPTAPGKSKILDQAKALTFGKAYDTARAARRFARNRFGI